MRLTSITRLIVAVAALSIVGIAGAGAQQPAAAGRGRAPAEAAPPAPPPGAAGTYLDNDQLMAVLKKSIAGAGGEMATSAVANTDQYRINVVHREKPAGAIAHPGNTELHYIIDGAATIVTGGTIVRAPGAPAGAATIQNGETRHMKKGDIIIVPPNTPHWYKDIEGTVTYLEVRFVAPAK
jgi:mannose-6-phosphate isomerase-like protein (cupin superfamily)